MSNYRSELIKRFWQYQKDHFPEWEEYFEQPEMPVERPPVFAKHAASHNVLMKRGLSDNKQKQLLDEIPIYERHRWFRSMSSSQALAQSIFGNLKLYDRLNFLNELCDESGEPLFGPTNITASKFKMEHSVDFLGEPRRTSVDAFISGEYHVAIECKLTESEVGPCSRPLLTQKNSNYETDFCDGTYTRQRGRQERCTLTEIGVLYWTYISSLFTWRSNIDLKPCPVNKNYQLVRNILAACVRPDGTLSPQRGHVVLIYDERNPAFQRGGKGYMAFEKTSMALRFPDLLKKCSWQLITKHLKNEAHLQWLISDLEIKYGF